MFSFTTLYRVGVETGLTFKTADVRYVNFYDYANKCKM